MAMKDASYWRENLSLEPHPDGGYYRQTYRSGTGLAKESLPEGISGPRPVSTAIYFLLDGRGFNHLHRLKSDELWHFYTGSSLTLHMILADGAYSRIHLGLEIEAGQEFQGVVPAGSWFGALVDNPESFSLVGCTVAPGFDFEDFEMGDREHLLARYPRHAAIIRRLTSPG
jgi:predicted cupin superfamily sugar epimerase